MECRRFVFCSSCGWYLPGQPWMKHFHPLNMQGRYGCGNLGTVLQKMWRQVVVSNIFSFHPYLGSFSSWLLFFKRVETTNVGFKVDLRWSQIWQVYHVQLSDFNELWCVVKTNPSRSECNMFNKGGTHTHTHLERHFCVMTFTQKVDMAKTLIGYATRKLPFCNEIPFEICGTTRATWKSWDNP